MYRPGIDADIECVAKSCELCNDTFPSQSNEASTLHYIRKRPGKKVGTDISSYGTEDYVIIVNFISFWPEIYQLRSGQVWGHTPEQRVASSTSPRYSLGLLLAIAQANARIAMLVLFR